MRGVRAAAEVFAALLVGAGYAAPLAGQAGRADSAATAAGDYRFWLPVGELRREYLVHVPQRYDGRRPVPVVIMLHGSGGSLDEISNATGWKLKSDDENFLAVFPNGFPNADGMRIWNDGRFSTDDRADDVAFVRELLADLSRRYRVDQRRQFVVGFSNGAGMAFRLASELGDRIAAFAPVAGRLSVAPATLARPVPMIAVIGTQDAGFRSAGRTSPGRWAALLGCTDAGDTTRQGRVVSVSYHCPAGTDATSHVIEGWAHYWPGGRNRGIEMWAEKVIWDFFRKHPLR